MARNKTKIKRKAISKKLRFEVFKRDGFTCAYCGQSPPSVVLEIDHIEPLSRGGEDGLNNYITACFDCNRGKKDIPLNKIPSKLSENLEVLKEKESQLFEYRKFIKKIERREKKDIEDISKVFSITFPDRILTDSFKGSSLKKFLAKLPKHEVKEAMEIATNYKAHNQDAAVKYFCGICWNKIRRAESDE